MSSRVRRRLLGACLSPLLALALPAPAQAQEITPRPAAGTITFSGNGFGHGRGMSQWGAYGAATKGLSYASILSFYYPGTTRSRLADDTIRVSITADNDGDTMVAPAAGLSVRAGGRAATLPTGSSYQAWRVVPGSGQLVLQFKDAAGAWKVHPLPFAAGPDVTFSTGSGVVALLLPSGARQELRGEVHGVLVGGRVRTVLHSGMESYLRSVVPNEMPASWHREALSAQSVAARTYAAAYRQRQRVAGSWFDICDTISCQVFGGVSLTTAGGSRTAKEHANSDAAIASTAGVVLRTGPSDSSGLVNAEFSASNGGWTAAGPLPYQVAKADPYDGVMSGSPHRWSTAVPVRSLDNAFGIGTFRRMVVVSRTGNGDLGGRVLQVRLDGDARSATVTGAQVRAQLGLRSDWFAAPTSALRTVDWNGDGKSDALMRDGNGDLRLYAGTGNGFGSWQKVGNGWGAMVDLLAAGDMDGRGGQDLIARRSDGTLWFYGGDGKGSWLSQRQIGRGWSPFRVLVAPGDWNGDGRPDVLAVRAGTEELVMSAGTADGALANAVRIGARWGAIVTLIAPGDVDGDGRSDLLAIDRGGDLFLYSGNGRGSFSGQRKVGHGWGGLAQVWSVGDVDGDGLTDLLAIDRAGSLVLYSGDGAGGWASRRLASGWSGLTPVR